MPPDTLIAHTSPSNVCAKFSHTYVEVIMHLGAVAKPPLHKPPLANASLTRTGRRCVRGGARSYIVRQTIVLKRIIVHWSRIVSQPCIVGPCIEYPLYCSAPCTHVLVSKTGRWLLTEELIVRDIMCCAMYAGNIGFAYELKLRIRI